MKAVLYIVYAILGTMLITIISLTIYFNEKLDVPLKIFIPKGSISQIISHLDKEVGGKLYPTDKYVVAYFGQPQSGWIQMPEKSMKRIEFLEAITKAKAPPSTKIITLIPGETTKYFIKLLTEKYKKDFDELYLYYLEISPIKEGFLIPDSYYINRERNLKVFLNKLVNHAKKVHIKYIKDLKLENFENLKKMLVIASIVQKESASKEEMKTVSSVIYNRLEKGMKLQMDGTLNYGLYSHIKITAKRIREDDSEFNTYKINGLPLTPICNPSSEAVLSAVYPEKTKYFYFMKLKNQKKHIFSETYKSHLKEVKKN